MQNIYWKRGIFINYIAIDLEAIAVRRGFDEIIEIGACRIGMEAGSEDAEKARFFSALIRPCFHTSIPKKITKITGITNEDIKGAGSFESAFEKLKEWAGKEPTFVGWGMQDPAWIRSNCRVFSLPHEWLTDNYIDLQRLYRTQVLRSRQMPSLALALRNEKLLWDAGKAHRALPDAQACAQVFRSAFLSSQTGKEVF